jgi:hypothetical protein
MEYMYILGSKSGKMVLAKLKNIFVNKFFSRQIFFFAQKDFPFPKYQKSFGGKKLT